MDQERQQELKFCPTNPYYMGVLSSRDIQIFELRKDFQVHRLGGNVALQDQYGSSSFGSKYKLKVIADVLDNLSKILLLD
jgi:hypothetical protein